MADQSDSLERELDRHDAFAPADDRYDLETTVLETRVSARETDDHAAGELRIVVTVPSLAAAVDGDVAAVVDDDWFETFARRLEDVFSVARTRTHAPPRVDREGDRVRVVLEYVADDARRGVEDAKALIEYVEGTFVQGLVPGYDYRGAAASLLENARSRGERAADGDSGTPI